MDDNQFLLETQAQQARADQAKRESTTARIALLGAALVLCSFVFSIAFNDCGERNRLKEDIQQCHKRLDMMLEWYGWPRFERHP